MRRSLETLLTAFLTVAASAACAQDRPNIVIFHCHDLGQYLHCYDPQRSIRTETHKLTANFSTAPSFQDPSQQWRPRSDPAVPEAPAVTEACNGDRALCGRRVEEMVFPPAHNSMAAADIPNWMFLNQERGIRSQLEDGVREFLIDIHYGVPVGDRVKTLIENEENARKKYEAALGKEGVEAAMRIRIFGT